MQNMNDEKINVVAIIALPEEHDTFCEVFPTEADISDEQLVRLKHNFHDPSIRLMSVLCENMGSENAMAAVNSAIQDLSPDLIICIGIAGSLSDDVKLGHVCVSSEITDILQNSKIVDKEKKRAAKGQRKGSISRITEFEFCTRPYSVENKLHANFRFFRSQPSRVEERVKWETTCTERNKSAYEVLADDTYVVDASKMALHVGPIVCGPVVSSKGFKNQLSGMNRKNLAIETESGGIFRAAQKNKVLALTIRGICDLADKSKSKIEKKSKNSFRKVAMQNACDLLHLQLGNASFISVARSEAARRNGVQPSFSEEFSATSILSKCESYSESYLESVSPDYKNRNGHVRLPLPRARKISIDEDQELLEEHQPEGIFDALSKEKRLFIKLPKSYPDNTLPWTIGLSILKYELDGKQPLPITFSGDQISPPSNDIARAIPFNFSDNLVSDSFSLVFIINEPQFSSKTRLAFLMSELKKFDDAYVIVVSKAESPISAIDGFKSDLGTVDYVTASIPFRDIAIYLEHALELEPGEADAAATRLDDTFSKFRLHTHPSYFIGIQESTINALINANQRAELIQLAVDGLLSFVVASDPTEVKMGRTTREEYLSDLAFKIRVEKKTFTQSTLISDAESFAGSRALEIEPIEFIQGFFKFGLLTLITGEVAFSLPFLESYLLSQRLISNPTEATRYFDPNSSEFDYFSFDLYSERGAHAEVIAAVSQFASDALNTCDDSPNAFSAKSVKPRSLGTASAFVSRAKEMVDVVKKITEQNSSSSVRNEKQRLIDARTTVRKNVGDRKKIRREDLSTEVQEQFARLDKLSRSQLLVATLIGSGAERLDGDVKSALSASLLTVSEKFLHHWTLDRQRIDFNGLRKKLLSDEAIDSLIEQMELYVDEREEVRENIALFIDDQEMKSLSSPLATILERISSSAGVRSLKPIVENLEPKNEIEALLRGSWYMDVEPNRGKAILKNALQNYKGSELFRLVLANHLMWRMFWHHWQKSSKNKFLEASRYSLKPMGLTTADRFEPPHKGIPSG